jgi:hypothetical protein
MYAPKTTKEWKEIRVMRRQRIGWRLVVVLAMTVVACGAAGAVALARSLAAPANTSPPTISGTAREGSTLTARNGTWSNNPTSFAYQWRRCATDGTACGDITGATKETYTLVTGDVSRTVRVEVTATNADGKGTETSDPTDVVDSKNGPTNSVRPAVSGSAQVGEELTVSNGTWSPAPTSFARLWQRCDSAAEDCRNIAGATGRTYGVRSADVGHRLRALVTARTSGGVATTASSPSGVVTGGQTTVTTSTTVQGNKAPSISFLSLKWVGRRVYARFRVCDDGPGRITIIERDNKARALSFTRRFSVVRTLSCGSFTRNWIPAARFRTRGRFVVTLRAVDGSNALSRLVSRSVLHS